MKHYTSFLEHMMLYDVYVTSDYLRRFCIFIFNISSKPKSSFQVLHKFNGNIKSPNQISNGLLHDLNGP